MRAFILIATLWAGGMRVVEAQTAPWPNTRQGFWVGLGLGAGSAGAHCSSCDTDRLRGFAGSIGLGSTLSQSLLIGGELDEWLNAESTVGTETITVGSLVVLWYPSSNGALFLRFGLGGMMHYWDFSGGGRYTFTAPTPSLGLGYEVRAGPRFSVCPYAKGLIGSTTRLREGPDLLVLDEQTSSGEHLTTFVQFGIGITFH